MSPSVTIFHPMRMNGRWSSGCARRHRYGSDSGYQRQRHGMNIVEGDSVVRNVGGSVFQGHRPEDSPTAVFLDGIRETGDIFRARVDYEPITNIFLVGAVAVKYTNLAGTRSRDLLARLQLRLEY